MIVAASLLPCGWFEELAKVILCIKDGVCNSLDVEDLLTVRLFNKYTKAWTEDDGLECMVKSFNPLHMNRRSWNFDEWLSISALRNIACFCNH